MKNYKKGLISFFTLSLSISLFLSCSRDTDELEKATFPTTPEVFIDGFSAGMEYEAFGESKLTAFNVDALIKYKGEASMRFDIPNSGDPAGGFAAGLFKISNSRTATVLNARDLSGYNVLTFWGKASESASVDELGFGFTFDDEKYKAYIKDTPFSTTWTKYYVPIPDASKLTQEKGLFYFVDAPDEGKGYSFWVDEVRFENLGTLAYSKAKIQNGQDREESAANGSKFTIGGLSMSANLPNGVDQEVIPATAYFDFTQSDNTVATVSNLGEVEVIGEGTTIITGSIGDIDANGSLKIVSSGAFIHAPTPTVDPANVISLFSNTYTNVPVEYYNGFWAPFQTTLSADFTIDGDDVLSYTDFNFVGTQFTAPTIDASNMTHLHLDLWIPNAVDPAAKLEVRIVDLGPDGSFDNPNPTRGMTYLSQNPLVSQTWLSLDISLAGLASKDKLAQIVYDNLGSPLKNFYVDNVYFYNDGGSGGGEETMPTEAAPTPMEDAANVISIYSDAYDDIAGTNLNPGWGQATVVTGEMIEGNNTLLYTGLDFQGIELGSSQNVSEMKFLHIDYWTANSSAFRAFLISPGSETGIALPVPTSGWGSIDIPLTDFTAVNLMDVFQMKFDGNGDIYLDNIYFYNDGGSGGGGTMPTEAAPTPMEDAANVISIYSDSYMNVGGTNLNPGWGQGTVVTGEIIEGNNTLLYTGLDFQGIELGSSQNVSEMDFLHIDYWTANSSAFRSFLISPGSETGIALPVPTSGWGSIDIPLSDFTAVNLMDVFQMKFDGNGDIYLDNIYFYKDETGGGDIPTVAAPTPMEDASNVISIYSDAYMNVAGTNLNPGWGQGTIVTGEMIEGNNTLLYTGLDFQGIELGSSQNVSEMDFLHIDYWTANSSAFRSFLISPGSETGIALPVPTSGWGSIDIPLTDFTAVNLMDVFQMKFDGNGDIYLDNIYFYKEGEGMTTEPSLPLTFENGETLLAFDGGAFARNVDNPDINGNSSAKVLEFNKIVGSAWYSGVVFDESLRTTPLIDLANGTKMSIKIWSPKAGITVRFQLEGGAAPAYEVFQVLETANQWVTMTFDFTSQVNATDTYPRFSIFPDFNTSNQNPVAVEAIYYLDDITQQ